VTRVCSRRGCKEQIREGDLMCRTCWFSVPSKLRTEVMRTWALFRARCRDKSGPLKPVIEAYEQARRSAIESVPEKVSA